MPKKILLLQAFFKKEFIIFRRYLFNSLGGMLTIYIVFLFLFGMYRGFSGPDFVGETQEALVVGYVLWFFILTTYQDVSYTCRSEAQQGTLEQLYMAVHGFAWVLGAKVIAGFFINLILVAVLLGAALLTTGTTVNVDIVSLFPVVVGTLLGALGIGFAVGGLTLVFKRIESYTQMVQFLLIALVAFPAEKIPWLRILPSSFGASLVRRIMIDGIRLNQIPPVQVLGLFCIGLAHLGLGYLIYAFCERKAMTEGTLGHY